ncbi:latrophilin Cirl isoform X2 [Bacillus rossius redtenbacheri]|uniref:latrophilin Cirl isoform X2 n=1 Tax=Bacillus rossius redtenbacheri TaxID=93214 RepID=UPI002FDD30BF
MEFRSTALHHCFFIFMMMLNLDFSESRRLEQPRYDTAYACESKTLKIECKDGEVIHLIRANYGRFSITICNDHGNTDWSVNCMSPKSLRVLHTKCSQQQNCSVLASTSMFGDPCPGTHKYLEAHYQCMPAATTTTTNRPSPPWLITSPPSVWNTAKTVTLRTSQKMPNTLENSPASSTSTSSSLNSSSGSSVTLIPVPDAHPLDIGKNLDVLPDDTEITTTAQPSSASPFYKSKHKTTATKPVILEYVPTTSVPWFHESDLMLCAPTTARNLFWNWTLAGKVNVQPCPGGAMGLARWRCVRHSSATSSALADWFPDTPDLSECRSVWLTSLESRVEEGDSILSIANDLSQVTSSKTLYGGDMMTTTKIIKKMSQKVSEDLKYYPDPRQREAMVTELLHGVVVTGSNLLDSSQHPSWHDLSHKEQMRVATSLLMGLEENAFLLADTVTEAKTVIKNVKNILLSVRVLKTQNVATEQFPSPEVFDQWKVSQDWLQIPRGALLENSEGGYVRLVFVAFDHLEEILQPQSESVRENEHLTEKKTVTNISRVLNSKIISASLGKGRHIQLSKPVRLSFHHLRTENVSNPSCVFWDFTISAWSDEGCRVESTNFTHTLCQCDHLTNFAILMDVRASFATPSHQMALQIITYIGCIISVVCLVLAIITFQLFRGLKSDRIIIHKNLCMCLLVAEVLFLAGIGQTDKPLVCGIVAGLLHFFFLCAFGWMFLEGFQLYVMLIEVFEVEKSRIRWYYIFAYGAPSIIVAVSSVVDPFSYGTDRYCWLRADNFFIFSFVGPVIAVILANLVFLSMAIYMMCRHASASTSMKSKEHSRLASARAWLRGAIMLVFLLGLTWTFGLLYLNKESILMAYIFTVLNSLQGLFIFIFHCVQNEKVRKEYRKFIRRHSWLPKCLRCSKHANSKERHSSVFMGSNGNPSAPNSHSTDSSALSPHGTSNISFKSCTRDSGHEGSEQEESQRFQYNTAAVCHLNSLNSLNRQSPRSCADKQIHSHAHPNYLGNACVMSQNKDCNDCGEPLNSQVASVVHFGNSTSRIAKKTNVNLFRSISPWNHTYTEIREGQHAPNHSHTHGHSYIVASTEDDPVYEEIERSDVQVSDMSDEDGKRQSDVSRQSSRSYGDHHPLITYSPAVDHSFHSCLDAALKQRLRELDHHSTENDCNNHSISPTASPYFYSGENARMVAVLDGETVVCHLRSDGQLYHHDPCNSRTVIQPTFEEY